jgi:serine protease Do
MSIPVPGRLAESVRQSVVQVQGGEGSAGSGVVIASGQVITNAHVIGGSPVRVVAWDGSVLPAKLTKINRSRDLALLAAPGLKAAALPLGDSRMLRPGMPVFAVGNPLGFVGAVSSGVIQNTGMRRWVCADVRLAPGNSGGPLTNFSGQVVGINAMVMRGGLALAIPSNAAERFLKHEDARNLGVVVRGAKFKHGFGVLVTGIIAGSPAERASLMPGDILTSANGMRFSHPDDLTDAIDNAAGGLLQLEFYRGDTFAARHVTANLVSARSERTAA